VKYAQSILGLTIPYEKTVFIGRDPIAFLGFFLDETSYRPLRKIGIKFVKKLKRATENGARLSFKAQRIQSFESWRILDRKRV
jgi:hypothetical protein